jgi:hypothetical protein
LLDAKEGRREGGREGGRATFVLFEQDLDHVQACHAWKGGREEGREGRKRQGSIHVYSRMR